jgi:hypothetical protein
MPGERVWLSQGREGTEGAKCWAGAAASTESLPVRSMFLICLAGTVVFAVILNWVCRRRDGEVERLFGH